jgi:hypothetical protein
MTAFAARLVGTEWEDWANRLLAQHFGATDYQRVPSKDRGDAGIEGYSVSSCEVFQCYGCEEPIGVDERFTKQRNKMTTDVGKFINNKATLELLLNPLKIRRWVLFVPLFDSKRLVSHAATKTKEVLAASLSYVDADFRVVVVQESSFSVARDQLLNATAQGLKLLAPPVTSADLNAWSQSNDSLLGVLKEKIARLPTLHSQPQREDFAIKVLKWYLTGQALLEKLREYPQVYEKVIEAKSHREDFLAMTALQGSASNVVVMDTIKGFHETLQREAKELHSFCAEQLAYEAVADWLMRCPLQFPEIANG